jgi:endo-1,4-beta-xylanase
LLRAAISRFASLTQGKQNMLRLLSFVLFLLLVADCFAAAEPLPVQGTPVLDGSKLPDFRLVGKGPKADFSFVPVEGQSFDRAIRVQVAAQTPNVYEVQILTPPTTVPLKKGEHILAVFNVRCTAAPDGVGVFNARLQSGAPHWTGIGESERQTSDVTAEKQWKQIYIHGQAQQDFAVGNYDLALLLSAQAQTLEFGGITILNLGRDVDVAKLPFTPITYPGQEPDAPWRKAAAERIEKYRKADLTVRVVDKDGKPVPGAKVHVQLNRHAYGFGTYLENQVMLGSGPNTDKLREWTLKLFNRCTTQITWADWGWANPEIRQKDLEAAQWAFDHHLATRGHCIIYPTWQNLPAAIKPLAKDPPALQKRILEQVAEVTEATRQFNFTEYDVTNELRQLKEIPNLLGRDAVAEWFKVARQHAPNSRMALNENTILTRGGVTQAEQDNFAEWIQYLIDQGQGPDVIGMQGHFGDAVTDPEAVLRILDRFAKFGKTIQVTEFTIDTRDEQGQARYLRDFLTVVFSHPSTDAVTVWGFWEGKIWSSLAAMIRKDWTLKPSGQAWVDLVLHEWHTDATAATGPDGSSTTRAFLGDYTITVTVGSQEKTAHVNLASPGVVTVVALD